MSEPLPTVVVYDIATADGRVALSPGVLLMHDRRWPWYDDGGYASVLRRHDPDALLEGSGTFVLPDAGPLTWPDDAESPPAARGEHFLPPDVLGRATRWFAVVDSRGRVRWTFQDLDYPGWEGTHVLVLVAASTPPAYLAHLRREQIPYLVVGDDRVDLTEALATMRAVLGVERVVATCGGELGGALLRAGLIDVLEIEVVPLMAGGRTTPALLTSPDLEPTQEPTRLHLSEATPLGDDRVLLSYGVVRSDRVVPCEITI